MSKIPINCKQHFVVAMLLLCSVFLHSCTEEMPILMPLNTVYKVNSVTLTINGKSYIIINKTPGYVNLTSITAGAGTSLYSQSNISASNSNAGDLISFIINFGPDTKNAGNYVLSTSQLSFNNKIYTTVNADGKANLKVANLNSNNNTANGTFGYYLYNSTKNPTDSIYVSGSFNILK